MEAWGGQAKLRDSSESLKHGAVPCSSSLSTSKRIPLGTSPYLWVPKCTDLPKFRPTQLLFRHLKLCFPQEFVLPTHGRAAEWSLFELSLSGQAEGASSPRHHEGRAEQASGLPQQLPQSIVLTSNAPSLLNSCHFSPKIPWSWTFHGIPEPGASSHRGPEHHVGNGAHSSEKELWQ